MLSRTPTVIVSSSLRKPSSEVCINLRRFDGHDESRMDWKEGGISCRCVESVANLVAAMLKKEKIRASERGLDRRRGRHKLKSPGIWWLSQISLPRMSPQIQTSQTGTRRYRARETNYIERQRPNTVLRTSIGSVSYLGPHMVFQSTRGIGCGHTRNATRRSNV